MIRTKNIIITPIDVRLDISILCSVVAICVIVIQSIINMKLNNTIGAKSIKSFNFSSIDCISILLILKILRSVKLFLKLKFIELFSFDAINNIICLQID